jgi:radical SAM superfamily enzyme YgiQ (UPF0313 family)
MSDILLVSAPLKHNEFAIKIMAENMGILYLEASLKKAGYSCYIIDSIACGLSYESTLKEILSNRPAIFLGFSVFYNNIGNTIRMIRDVREKGFRGHITMGGMWPSFKYKEILNQIPEVDSVAVGEGEFLSVSLADSISKGKDYSNINGLATRGRDNSIIFTPGKLQDNIDIFPLPERNGYYSDIIKEADEVSILSSRGCHGRCTFCTIASYIKLCGGKRWRPRDPVRVVDEIENIINNTGIKNFRFLDDNFIGPGRIERENSLLFAQEIIRRKLDIKFIIFPRIEGIEYELFSKLKEGGLKSVDLGIESFSETQLKRYNKMVTVEKNLKAIEILKKLNISYNCYLIFIDPYVTLEEMKENLLMVDKIGLEHFSGFPIANFLTLNQYQPIFRLCLKDGLVKNFHQEDIDNLNIEYSLFHSNVSDIVKASTLIFEIYYKCFNKLDEMKKRMPSKQWGRICGEICSALKNSFYKYFRECLDSGQEGPKFIDSKMGHIYEHICSFADTITGEDILEFKEHIIDIDGIKISTLPEYSDYFPCFQFLPFT